MGCSTNNTLAARFWAKVCKSEGCWLWTAAVNPQGYGLIKTMAGMSRAHRVSYELNVGPISSGRMVRHTCDVPGCVNPSHLVLGTARDNVLDRVSRGRSADRRGENHPLAKLCAWEIAAIRKSSFSGKDLAEVFEVSQASVSFIRNNKRWSHI